MTELNTMFNTKSNNTFNNILFNSYKIACMNAQMERLYRAARELKKIEGKSELARALNSSPQTINNWEERGISKQGMLTAQNVIGCYANWLETGIGPMAIGGVEANAVQFDQNVASTNPGSRRIPLISYVQAGTMTEVSDPYAVGSAESWIEPFAEVSSNAFALRIKGESMLPEFREGDVVIIDPNVSPEPGDFVVAKNTEEEATFKKYRPRGVNERGDLVFELVPINEDYPSIRSDHVHVRIIGVMVECRKLRKR